MHNRLENPCRAWESAVLILALKFISYVMLEKLRKYLRTSNTKQAVSLYSVYVACRFLKRFRYTKAQ